MKTLSKRLVSHNEIFNIYYYHVQDENFNEVKNYLVVKPKTLNRGLIAGVAVLPILSGKLSLVRVDRPALNGSFWEIPHGSIEPNETPLAATIRELREETGIQCEVKNLTFLCRMAPDSGILGGLVEIYTASASVPSGSQLDEFGLGKMRLFCKKELRELINNNEVVDSFTIVAFLKATEMGLIN